MFEQFQDLLSWFSSENIQIPENVISDLNSALRNLISSVVSSADDIEDKVSELTEILESIGIEQEKGEQALEEFVSKIKDFDIDVGLSDTSFVSAVDNLREEFVAGIEDLKQNQTADNNEDPEENEGFFQSMFQSLQDTVERFREQEEVDTNPVIENEINVEVTPAITVISGANDGEGLEDGDRRRTGMFDFMDFAGLQGLALGIRKSFSQSFKFLNSAGKLFINGVKKGVDLLAKGFKKMLDPFTNLDKAQEASDNLNMEKFLQAQQTNLLRMGVGESEDRASTAMDALADQAVKLGLSAQEQSNIVRGFSTIIPEALRRNGMDTAQAMELLAKGEVLTQELGGGVGMSMSEIIEKSQTQGLNNADIASAFGDPVLSRLQDAGKLRSITGNPVQSLQVIMDVINEMYEELDYQEVIDSDPARAIQMFQAEIFDPRKGIFGFLKDFTVSDAVTGQNKTTNLLETVVNFVDSVLGQFVSVLEEIGEKFYGISDLTPVQAIGSLFERMREIVLGVDTEAVAEATQGFFSFLMGIFTKENFNTIKTSILSIGDTFKSLAKWAEDNKALLEFAIDSILFKLGGLGLVLAENSVRKSVKGATDEEGNFDPTKTKGAGGRAAWAFGIGTVVQAVGSMVGLELFRNLLKNGVFRSAAGTAGTTAVSAGASGAAGTVGAAGGGIFAGLITNLKFFSVVILKGLGGVISGLVGSIAGFVALIVGFGGALGLGIAKVTDMIRGTENASKFIEQFPDMMKLVLEATKDMAQRLYDSFAPGWLQNIISSAFGRKEETRGSLVGRLAQERGEGGTTNNTTIVTTGDSDSAPTTAQGWQDYLKGVQTRNVGDPARASMLITQIANAVRAEKVASGANPMLTVLNDSETVFNQDQIATIPRAVAGRLNSGNVNKFSSAAAAAPNFPTAQPLTNNTTSNTTISPVISPNITINASPGMDAQEIARQVLETISNAYTQEINRFYA